MFVFNRCCFLHFPGCLYNIFSLFFWPKYWPLDSGCDRLMLSNGEGRPSRSFYPVLLPPSSHPPPKHDPFSSAHTCVPRDCVIDFSALMCGQAYVVLIQRDCVDCCFLVINYLWLITNKTTNIRVKQWSACVYLFPQPFLTQIVTCFMIEEKYFS